MKKKIAALLCGVMCLTGFTGCSDTELAYLQMSKDMLQMMDACEVSGTTQVDVDLDAMQGFLSEAAQAANSIEPTMPDGLNGKKSVTLDYVMQMDMNQMEYVMDLDLTYEKEKYDLGTLSYSMTDGIYYSAEGLLGLYDFAGDILDADTKAEAGYFFEDAYAADLKAALAKQGDIALLSAEDLTGIRMEEVLPDGIGNLYDAVFTFYEDVLQGFETGMVKKANGGFVIEADGQAVADMFIRLLDFIAANPNQVLDATEAYMAAVTAQMGMTAEENAEVSALFAEAKANEAEFVETVCGIRDFMQVILEEESVQMLLNGFQYDAAVKRSNGGFLSEETTLLTHNGKEVCKVTSEGAVKAANISLQFPTKTMSMDALAEKLGALHDKYNPVTGVCVNWGWEDTNTEALIWATRAEEVPFGIDANGAEWTDIIVRDGRTYVPLRVVCAMLDENISWDRATKSAFVTVDGKNIEMDGILQDGTSFVGVREFEKLGYCIDYTSAEGEYSVDIYRWTE